MKRNLFLGVAVSMCVAPAFGQSFDAVDGAPVIDPGVGIAALGDFVSFYDVQQFVPTGDLQLLGVEYEWDTFFVTGRNLGDYRIYYFDSAGNYLGELDATSSSPVWGHRDLASNGDLNLLYAGAENGEFTTYQWNGSSLSFVRAINVAHRDVVRALARNELNDSFYSINFGGTIYNFDGTTGATLASWPNPGALAAYGAAWDCDKDTFWVWSQTGTPAVLATELNPATMTPTGRSFQGVTNNPLASEIAGGADIDEHPDNPGMLSFIGMHQIDGTTLPQEGITIYDLDAPACGGLSFAVAGNCPGTMTFTVSGATPGGNVAIVYGFGNSLTIPNGNPCAGTQLDVGNPRFDFRTVRADASGVAVLQTFVPAAACDRVNVQALDVTTCATSNVVNP